MTAGESTSHEANANFDQDSLKADFASTPSSRGEHGGTIRVGDCFVEDVSAMTPEEWNRHGFFPCAGCKRFSHLRWLDLGVGYCRECVACGVPARDAKIARLEAELNRAGTVGKSLYQRSQNQWIGE